MTCCEYLPDGRVGFMHARPKIGDNKAMNAGGLRFDVIEPFKRLNVRYEGELLVMDEPLAMADPGSAFKRFPKKPALIELEFEWCLADARRRDRHARRPAPHAGPPKKPCTAATPSRTWPPAGTSR